MMVDAAAIVPLYRASAGLHRELCDAGWELRPRAATWRVRHDLVRVRLVWRNRATRMSAHMIVTLRLAAIDRATR